MYFWNSYCPSLKTSSVFKQTGKRAQISITRRAFWISTLDILMVKVALASRNFVSLETTPPAVVSINSRPSARRMDPIEEEVGHEIHDP